ncbi:alanyl-tRNA editing protein [Halomicrococcus gelatinilyticus]|uniref:alanyl-tRNA editing protein n=1 Tax=Halomicrococcus gelatinilyticus TaxID=1702103 RepID=UPI002E0F5F29
MTRAPAEPYERSFEATVDSVDGREVVLSETYFYAESGGQPADRGTVGGVQVADVQKRDGDVVHVLDADPSLSAGEAVSCEVDDAFRTYCMRAHTASHVLYGAGRRVLDDLGYGGFDIDDEKVRIDFTTSTEIDDDALVELERLANRAVWESRPVSWEQVDRDEAAEREAVAFNTKTEEGVFDDAEEVRVVTIGGETADGDPWDVAACGGTHVRNTKEVGPVTVLDRSNPGEGLTRVEFAVGPRAIRERRAEKAAALDAARAAGTSVGDLADEVERLTAELESVESELADAKADLVDARVAELAEETVERDGREWLVGTVDGVGPNELDDRVRELAGEVADVVVLTGEDGATFLVVGTDGDLGAGDVVDEVTGEFGGGGGGSPTFAQGGGLDAAPEDVVAYLRE